MAMSKVEPPHSKETEMMVLGCMLSKEEALRTAACSIHPHDFYFQEHKHIFQALQQLYREGKPGEIYLAAEELRQRGQLEAAGGIAYLAALAQFSGAFGNVQDYVELLLNQSFHRQAFHLLEEGKKELFNESHSPAESIEKVRHKLVGLSRKYSTGDKASLGDILSGTTSKVSGTFLARIEERRHYYKRNNKPFMAGLPTGFAELDKEATLLEKTNLVVVAARPSMGKTAFAINLANYVCIEKQKPVALFSLEMGADQLVERLFSLRSGISGEKIKRGELTDAELFRLQEEEHQLRSAKFFIQDKNCSTIAQIEATASRLKEEEGVELFIIDYLQLLSGSGSENRQYEVAEISRKLKLLTLELQTPILCISQLSRKVEERQGHRPQMSDLRDSGQIEQDSDVVLFIQRRDYYEPGEAPGLAEIIVAKNRNGAVFSSTLHFDGACGRFSSPERPQAPPPVSAPTKVRTTRHLRTDRYIQPDFHPLLR